MCPYASLHKFINANVMVDILHLYCFICTNIMKDIVNKVGYDRGCGTFSAFETMNNARTCTNVALHSHIFK
jgi:hypothetical protein